MAGESVIRKALKARVEQYGGEVRAVAWLGRRNAPDVLCLLFPQPFWCKGIDRLPHRGFDKSEFSDRYYCVKCGADKGKSVYVETKAPGGKPSAAQAREHERMRAAGCTVLVISTLEQLGSWLPPLG
jgi:hypothetical protein